MAGILGWDDDEPLLGFDDDVPLEGWSLLIIPGQFDPSTAALGGAVGDRVFLVTASLIPQTGSDVGAVVEGPHAIASYPISGHSFETGAAEIIPTEIRCADKDFVTLANDSLLPSIFFDGRVTDPGSLNLGISLVPVGASSIETSFGTISVDNTDGAYDTLLDQVTAISQEIVIRGGKLGIDLADFVTIFTGRITGVGLTETEMTLEVTSPVLYAQNIYPTSVYTGLGGISGDADLEGVTKPIVLGRVYNVGAILINAANLVYQVHDGTIGAVTSVFDGGVALSFGANYANYAALIAAAVPAGTYSTSLTDGLIRVGGTPAYALTAHINGASAAGVTVQSISKWLIQQLDSLLDLDVDDSSFDALPTWQAGWVWNAPFSFAEAISRFVGDGGFYWGADTDGMIRAIQLTSPDGAETTVIYDQSDIMSIERVSAPAGYEGVHNRRQVLYRRNWTVQSDGELAVAAVDRAGRQLEWRTATATVPPSSLNSIDPPILETSLRNAADAAELAAILLGMHGVSRRMFSVEVEIFGVLPKIGDTVVVKYPRFGLVDGAVFRVVAIDLRISANLMRLLLWGGEYALISVYEDGIYEEGVFV